MKHQISKLLGAGLASTLVALSAEAQAYERIAVERPQDCSIELNGDSILHGYFNSPPNDVLAPTPADWLRAYGYPVDDRAANGQSTYQLARNGFFSAPHTSRIVVIQTGINDFRREYESGWFYVPTVEGVKQDYRAMVDHVRAMGQIPVIAGVTQLQYPNNLGEDAYRTVEQIRAAVREVAAEKSVHYASFDINPLAWTDTIHLDQPSSNGIAENLRYVAAWICSLPF